MTASTDRSVPAHEHLAPDSLVLRLGQYEKEIEGQRRELRALRRTLDQRVQEQVAEVERLGRLRRFLSPQLADAVVGESGESLLATHRRRITVLFADLRGFTAFTDSAEPEEVMRILAEFHEAVGLLVEQSEATVGDFAGDGVMVYFNDPLPVPDPTERAVRMALGLRERMADLAMSWRRLGHHLGVGIGISEGYATLGMVGFELRSDYKPVGTVVNLAARLCAEAQGGQILISQQAYASVEVLVEADSVGEFQLKGLHRPVPAFAVRGVREGTVAPESLRARAPMFGRDLQLRELEPALRETAPGPSRVVLISGEPGIGKTRLTEELADRATAAGAGVFWGHCVDREGAPAFWPWMEVVTAIVRSSDPSDLRAALGSGAGAIAQIVPELADVLPGIEPPPPVEPSAARFRLYEALERFLRRLGDHRPVVVVLEDVQWSDAPSLQLLEHVASQPKDGHLLLLVTYRDTDPVVGPPLTDTLANLARLPETVRAPLTGLSAADVADFIGSVSSVEPTQGLVASVHGRTEGNPFFVAELVRLLESEAAGGAGTGLLGPVPVGVRDVVRRRLARLPEPTTRLLSLGAVAGREADLELWARLAGLPVGATVEALEPAFSARLLVPSPANPGRVRFSHALVNETLYNEVSTVQRAALHGQVGEAMKSLYGPDDDSHLSALAHHFFLSAPVHGPGRGLDYALRSAESSERRLAYEQAEQQLRRALELIRFLPSDERPGRELGMQMRLIVMLTGTQGFAAPPVGAALSRAKELCGHAGEPAQAAAVLWGLCSFHLVRAEFDIARGYGDELLDVGERSGEQVSRLAGSWALGMVDLLQGSLDDARNDLECAIALADSVEIPGRGRLFVQEPSAHCRAFLGLVLWLSGEEEEARRRLDEAITIAGPLDNKFSLANALLFDAMRGVFGRDADLVLRRSEETMTLADAHGYQLFRAAAAVLGGWAVAQRTDPRAGRRQMEEALSELADLGATMFEPFHLALLADVLLIDGLHQDARSTLVKALEMARQPGERFWEAELHRLQARAIVADNPRAQVEAQASLRRAHDVAHQQGARPLEARVAADMAALAAP